MKRRQALNKFNAPEMLGALFKALQAAGLEDAVDELRKMKIPQLIDQAWRKREKLGSEEVVEMTTLAQRVADRHLLSSRVVARHTFRKQGVNILQTLNEVFQPLQPLVTNWRASLKAIADTLVYDNDWLPEDLEVEKVDALQKDTLFTTVRIPGNRRGNPDNWEPDDEADVELGEVPTTLRVTLKRELHGDHAVGFIEDAVQRWIQRGQKREVYKVLREVLHNGKAEALLAKILANSLQHLINRDMDWIKDLVSDDDNVYDVMRDDFRGQNLDWKVTDAKAIKNWFQIQGSKLLVYVLVDVGVEAEGEYDPSSYDDGYDGPEDDDRGDYDEGDYFDYGRYASLSDHMTRKAIQISDKIAKACRAADKEEHNGNRWSDGGKSNGAGVLYLTWKNRQRNIAVAKLLWDLFEHRGGPSLDVGQDMHNFIRLPLMDDATLAAVTVITCKKLRMPRVAQAAERLLTKALGDVLDAPADDTPMKRPGDVFEDRVRDWENLASKVWSKVKTSENALNFSYDLAEDINWHSLNRTGLLGAGDSEGYYDLGIEIADYGMKIDFGLESAAALIVALLRKAGEKGRALTLKRYAIKEFPESFED